MCDPFFLSIFDLWIWTQKIVDDNRYWIRKKCVFEKIDFFFFRKRLFALFDIALSRPFFSATNVHCVFFCWISVNTWNLLRSASFFLLFFQKNNYSRCYDQQFFSFFFLFWKWLFATNKSGIYGIFFKKEFDFDDPKITIRATHKPDGFFAFVFSFYGIWQRDVIRFS